nr:hypothetical protein CFP56_31707 [Quercus suber]
MLPNMSRSFQLGCQTEPLFQSQGQSHATFSKLGCSNPHVFNTSQYILLTPIWLSSHLLPLLQKNFRFQCDLDNTRLDQDSDESNFLNLHTSPSQAHLENSAGPPPPSSVILPRPFHPLSPELRAAIDHAISPPLPRARLFSSTSYNAHHSDRQPLSPPTRRSPDPK